MPADFPLLGLKLEGVVVIGQLNASSLRFDSSLVHPFGKRAIAVKIFRLRNSARNNEMRNARSLACLRIEEKAAAFRFGWVTDSR